MDPIRSTILSMGSEVEVKLNMERGQFCVVTSIGEVIEIPGSVYTALDRLLGKHPRPGKAIIEGRNRGISGVRFEEVLK